MTLLPNATLDDLFGGALPGRLHLVSGGPGSGKTSIGLQFLRVAMSRGERAALLTIDRPEDLESHANHLGLDMRAAVRDARLSVIRFRNDFTKRVAATATPRAIVDDLDRMFSVADLQRMNQGAPMRICIDTISPFLGDGAANHMVIAALADWLDTCGATTLVTMSGNIGDDRRVEKLVERAAVIAALERIEGLRPARFRARIVRARHAMAEAGSVDFAIQPRSGLATLEAEASAGTDRVLEPFAPLVAEPRAREARSSRAS